MTLTPEDLAEIEARARNVLEGGIIRFGQEKLIIAEDNLDLIAALKEAWAKNDQLREALKTFAAEETTQARRLRAGIVAARQKLELTRFTWNGPIHQADGILAAALSVKEPQP